MGRSGMSNFIPSEEAAQHILGQSNSSSFARSFDNAKSGINTQLQNTAQQINNYKRAVAAFKKTSTSFVDNIQKQQKMKADAIKQNI